MNKRSRRWRLQFSVGSLLWLMLAAAAFFAGRASHQREMENARQAAEEARLAEGRARLAVIQARYAAALAQAQAAAQASSPYDPEIFGDLDEDESENSAAAPPAQAEPLRK